MSAISIPPVPPGRRPLLLRECAGLLVCALLIVLLIARLDPAISLQQSGTRATALHALLLNALPALTAWALLLAVTRRLLLSSWLVMLLIGGLYAANSAKLAMLHTPLLPADLRFLGEPGPALELFSRYLHIDTLHWLLIAGGLAFTIALLRERRLVASAGRRALTLGLVALLLGYSLVKGTPPWRWIYQSATASFQPWALAKSSASTGLFGSLLLYNWQIGDGTVPAPDRAAALALLSAHAPQLRAALATPTTSDALPDIVIVQSESLFDPARLKDVAEGRWLPQYHRLTNNAMHGNLVVPTFVGGTIRTEFEVLTGAPLASLGGVQYPWLELTMKSWPGLTRVLDAHGYRSTAVHPNSGAFWNRDKTYPALGFDRFMAGDTFGDDHIVGLFTSDAAMTDRVLEVLGEGGPPQFLFAVSMENHGPFDWRPNLDPKRLAALPMPEKLDAGGRLWFGNYLYLLDDADAALGRLATALAQRKRRTLLLFYGDHLPGLAPVYYQLGFDDGRDPESQPVPWLLIDTADSREQHADLRTWMLPALLLDRAGIRDDPYFNILTTLTQSPQFDPADPATATGLKALAQLQLRGELAPLVEQALTGNTSSAPTTAAHPHP